MIFSGPEGVGKEFTALDFARKLSCRRENPCLPREELCASCKSAVRLEHPAIHLVYPTPAKGKEESEEDYLEDIGRVMEEKRQDIFSSYAFSKKVSIRVAHARNIIKRANVKPFGSSHNIFIIVDAHAMREEAQNALLKLVEEPPASCILILVTPNSDALLYTIRSRCQTLRFPPLKTQVIQKILCVYYGIEKELARRAAALSRGSIRQAKEIAASSDDRKRLSAAELAEVILDAPKAWLVVQAQSAAQGSKREEVAVFLHELEIYFRDVMAGAEQLYFNADSRNRIKVLQKRWRRENLPPVIDMIASARDKVLRRNMNISAVLAHLFLDIQRTGC